MAGAGGDSTNLSATGGAHAVPPPFPDEGRKAPSVGSPLSP